MRRTPPLLNFVLFLLTTASVLFVGGLSRVNEGLWAIAREGAPYAASLMGILLAHELGHYVLGRAHRVDVSLPYFLPMPLGLPGTFGAVIRMRSRIPSRRAVLDIGAAGPIAGFLVALPLVFWGFAHSEVIETGGQLATNATFQCPFNLARAVLSGQPLQWHDGAPGMQMGDSIITWLAARLTHGPLREGTDLQLHPVGLAAWFALFVTTLNLTPVGQLDGGHVIYALFGQKAERLSRACSWALFGLGVFASWSWFLWWGLTRLLVGVRHPAPDDEAPLSRRRRLLAIAVLGILVLTFVPVPIYL